VKQRKKTRRRVKIGIVERQMNGTKGRTLGASMATAGGKECREGISQSKTLFGERLERLECVLLLRGTHVKRSNNFVG